MPAVNRIRSLIASLNGTWPADQLAAIARKYLNAYNNNVNWEMEYNGELKALCQVIGHVEGDVLDVGANAGQWATAMLPNLGGKELHCFEPMPAVFERLTAVLGKTAGVKLNNVGLGREPATLTFNYSPGVNTITSVYDLVFDRDDQQRVHCAVKTGDQYLAEARIDKVSILKIDVEGMEMDVLEGFENAFTRSVIGSVQFEHGEAHIMSGHMLKDFADFFDQRDFDLFLLLPNKLKLLRYTYAAEGFEGRNFFAIRKDISAKMGLVGSAHAT